MRIYAFLKKHKGYDPKLLISLFKSSFDISNWSLILPRHNTLKEVMAQQIFNQYRREYKRYSKKYDLIFRYPLGFLIIDLKYRASQSPCGIKH